MNDAAAPVAGDMRPFSWAYRAHQRFVATLSTQVRANFENAGVGSDPYVVVFGCTQVGKTTLLLELMGVAAHAQQRVSGVLRAGRPLGKSATATTMEYRRSQDTAWRMGNGPDALRFDDDHAMCAALTKLREAMSAHCLDDIAPVVVAIPGDCFDDEASSGRGTGPRMLDLPGEHPEDPVEAEHVQRVAARYVPYADMILLVGRADGLTFLDPEALALPGIEDWQLVPNRFRIITTYSFTPDTVRQYVQSVVGELNPDQFRTLLLKEIDTFKRPLTSEAREPRRFFPLEIGDSWLALEYEEPCFAGRVAPVLKSLMKELRSDIQNSANEAARFRNAFDVHVIAQRKREACRQEGKAALADLDMRIDTLDTEVKLACKAFEDAAERELNLCKLLEQAPAVRADINATMVLSLDAELAAVRDIHSNNQTNTTALLKRIDEFRSWLRFAFLHARPSKEVISFLGRTRPAMREQTMALDQICAELNTLSAQLHRYWNPEYYPSVSDKFTEDLSVLRNGMVRAAAKASATARACWHGAVTRRCAELIDQEACAAVERAEFSLISAERKQVRDSLLEQRNMAQAELERVDQRLQQDAESGKRFVNMLLQEYQAELRARCAAIANPAAPAAALFALLSTHTLAEERRQIESTCPQA